ncbi:MAG: hypothetical protein R3F14_18065 [Polyangiaceae bacterium]
MQVRHALEYEVAEAGVELQAAVVVAGDDHLVRVGQRREPAGGGAGLGLDAPHAEVACVNEDVAVRDVELVVESVRVAQEHEARHRRQSTVTVSGAREVGAGVRSAQA